MSTQSLSGMDRRLFDFIHSFILRGATYVERDNILWSAPLEWRVPELAEPTLHPAEFLSHPHGHGVQVS